MNDGKQKLEIGFLETQRTLILNATNAHKLAEELGPDPDEWIDRKIVIGPERVRDPKGQFVNSPPVRARAAPGLLV